MESTLEPRILRPRLLKPAETDCAGDMKPRRAGCRLVKLYPEGRRVGTMKVRLIKPPVPPEICAITTEPIGSVDAEVPFAPAGPPLSACPQLTCAELPCGHRFHASAILVHLLRNSLRCPLCRAGCDACARKTRLPRGEPWFTHTSTAVEADRAREREVRYDHSTVSL